MKTLNDYTEDATTKLFNDTGTFFAFNKEQVDNSKKEGVEYIPLGMGDCCPKDNIDALIKGLKQIGIEGRKQDLLENGKKKIIHRELSNHEYGYTGDTTQTIEALRGYDISEEEIEAEAKEYLRLYND